MPGSLLRRLAASIRAAWPTGAAGRVLAGLLVAGVALRLLAIISSWPTTVTLQDGYQIYAGSNPFLDPLHPAGYSLLLAAIGAVTHRVAVTVALQHVGGVAAALLLGAATRRVTGSAWAGLLPAGVMLLDPDGIFLENAIMSESWAMLAAAIGLYAAVRTFDQPRPLRRWPLLTGVALAVSVTIRTAGLPLIVVTVVALWIFAAASVRGRRVRWRAPLTVAGVAAIVLLAFAGANARFGVRFGIEPTPGWYLYGRVAQFADCRRFTPPPGTAALCQNTPVSQRRSGYYYMFDPRAPAARLFGGFGHDDRLIGTWAERALRAQVGDYLTTAWAYLRSYFVPGWRPARLKSSTELDPQLDFTYANVYFADADQAALEQFFDSFTDHPLHWGLQALRDVQRVIRFGATALLIATILTLIGLLIGSRRSRAGAVLFGLGGLSLLIAPSLTSTYSGRYTVPTAGPLLAAAASAITELWRLWAARRRGRQIA